MFDEFLIFEEFCADMVTGDDEKEGCSDGR